MFQEHNFIKRDHPELERRVAEQRNEQKAEFMSSVFVFYRFFSLRQHGILLCFFTSLSLSLTQRPSTHHELFYGCVRVWLLLIPLANSKRFLPLATTGSERFSSCLLQGNLFFSSRRWARWNGWRSANRAVFLIHKHKRRRKNNIGSKVFLPERMAESEWKSEAFPPLWTNLNPSCWQGQTRTNL